MLRVNQLAGFGARRAVGAAPAVLTYIGRTDSTANASTYTLTDASIGAAAADRVVVVCVLFTAGGTGRSISSVTIGGNAATAATSIVSLNAAGGQLWGAIYYLAVPSGTTATIVATTSGGAATSSSISVYTMTGNVSATPTDSATGTQASGTTVTANSPAAPDIPANGIAIGIAHAKLATGFTWSGLTEDNDAQIESVGYTTASASGLSAETGRSIVATFTSGAAVIAAAVWN